MTEQAFQMVLSKSTGCINYTSKVQFNGPTGVGGGCFLNKQVIHDSFMSMILKNEKM